MKWGMLFAIWGVKAMNTFRYPEKHGTASHSKQSQIVDTHEIEKLCSNEEKAGLVKVKTVYLQDLRDKNRYFKTSKCDALKGRKLRKKTMNFERKCS